MASTHPKATFTGTIWTPAGVDGVPGKLIATPLTQDQRIVLNDGLALGPETAVVLPTGAIQAPGLKIPIVADVLWNLRFEPDEKGRSPWSYGAVNLNVSKDVKDLLPTEVTVMDATTVADLLGAADQVAADRIAVEAVGTTNDTIIAGRINATGSATQVALTTAIAPIAASGFVAPSFDAPTVVTDIPIAVLDDGVLYARNGSVIKSSTDGGASWTTIRDLGATGGEIITIKDTSGGEVLIVRASAIYRSTGWAANKATATLTSVLSAPGVTSFYQWGVDTHPATGVCTAATYVGTMPYNDARYVWVSTDGGSTWTIRFDINDHVAEVGGTLADCHTHNTHIDRWGNDRLWMTWHRATVTGTGHVMYSDDLGLTWNRLDTTHAGSGSSEPTAIISVRGGMVFGTDEQPNGVYVVARTQDPADMVYQFAYRWAADATGVAGFSQWATRSDDGERAYLAFIGDLTFKPIIVQSDGITASRVFESPDPITTSLGDGFRTVLYLPNSKTVLAVDRRGTTYSTIRGRRTIQRTPQVAPSSDPGWALGGNSWGIRSLALHPTSQTLAARSVAAGALSRATSTDAVAVGDSSAVTGSGGTALGASSAASGTNSTAVGFGATALGANGVALGRAAVTSSSGGGTAVGDSASVTGGNGTAVGSGANVLSSSVAVGQGATADASCVVIGQGADSTADLNTVVGHAAKGGGAYGTVVGESALISGTTQHGVALGRSANVASGHTSAVALGDATVTTAANQVQVGPRHFEAAEVAEPAAPAADSVRVYAVDNGSGQTEYRARFNGGNIVTLAIQGGLTRLTPKATGSRPTAATVGAGAQMFDTTLNKPIWSTGAGWVDATGATA